MPVICPTITAAEPHEYRQQMEEIQAFISRVHLDFADGVLSPVKLVNIIQAWWPESVTADFHVMYDRPDEHLETFISLKPNLVIVHAEAHMDHEVFFAALKTAGIKSGLALLQGTAPQAVHKLLTLVDHVLIFSGDLGHFGGHVDEQLYTKVADAKAINPALEIGWDGGINADNAAGLVQAGVDVLNVGGFIHRAEHPEQAYATLINIVENTK